MINLPFAHNFKSLPFLCFIFNLVLVHFGGWACVQATHSTSICEGNEYPIPYLVISTQEGTIEIELFERAAPQAVRRLTALVKGPIFNQDLLKDDEKSSSVGYYDGLTFNHTRPHLEIATSERSPAGLFQIESEIDAESLGLDRILIENRADAMSIMQRELLAAHRKKKKKGNISPQLSLWLEKWKATYNPDFLIGVSRKEVNEALGYVYKTGLESKPATKGSVALRPVTPQTASPRLTIFLQDMPDKTGKWMIIGRVVKGLELADKISLQPLVTPSHIKPRSYTPLHPVVIDSIKWSCRK